MLGSLFFTEQFDAKRTFIHLPGDHMTELKAPAVSVIIPVYNTAKWLPDCIDSVLRQTKRDIEVICVDDCSTDPECRRILNSYRERDSRVVTVFLEDNGKQGRARNIGMDKARGKYYYFLDSDDMIEPEALEKLYDLAEKESLQAIFFDYSVICDEGCKPGEMNRKAIDFPREVVAGEKLLEVFLKHKAWLSYVQRQFWNAAYLKENGIHFIHSEHEDEYFSLTGIILAQRVKYLPEKLFIRRFREGSVMTKPIGATNTHGYLCNIMEMNRFAREHSIRSKAYHDWVSALYNRFVYCYETTKDKKELAEWFRTPEERDLYDWFLAGYRSLMASRSYSLFVKIRKRIYYPLRDFFKKKLR